MQRRDFLKSASIAALMPQLRAAVPLKITDIRIVNLKVVREIGKMEMAWNPGTITTQRIGGGSRFRTSARLAIFLAGGECSSGVSF